jgi:hypothetical protein
VNWLSDNWRLLFDGVGGTAVVTFIGYLCKQWWESRHRPSGEGATLMAERATVSDSPVASGSGNTQNINSPTTINVSLPHPSPVQAATALQPQPKPRHNIEFIEAKSVQAHSGVKDGKIHESPQGLGEFHVGVVCFRNEPVVGKRVQEPTLKSHIIYKGKNGEEITDVPRGVWLGELGETTVFESGKKKCLIIFLLSNLDTFKKLWNEEYHSETSWMAGGPVFQIRDEGMRGDVTSVEVRLLDHNICTLQAVFEVGSRIGGGLPELILRSLSVA